MTNNKDNYSSKNYKFCKHLGIEPIYTTANDLVLHGATKTDIEIEVGTKTLIVNCTGTSLAPSGSVKNPIMKVPEGMDDLLDNKYVLKLDFHEVLLDWADNQAPLIQPQFWADLSREAKAQGYTDITICCFGGHGRTGTALAAIMIADGIDIVDAVNHVRKFHCDEAVETTSQMTYLQMVQKTLHRELTVEAVN